MNHNYEFKNIGMGEIAVIKSLFTDVFTAEPWNDDWSDEKQLDCYLEDLVGQNNSLTYGLFENDNLIAVSMGHIKHWYSGTEYYIDELCVQTDRQGKGVGSFFLTEISKAIREKGIVHIFLLTESDVPAYEFYQKNGFRELKTNVAFTKKAE